MATPKTTKKTTKTIQEKTTSRTPTPKKTASKKVAKTSSKSSPPKPPTSKNEKTQWFKKPLWVIVVLIIVIAIAYFAIGNNDEVSQAEASQIVELQEQLAELRAEKESEVKAKEEFEVKAKAAAAEKKKQQEIADLIAAAEAKAKKEARAEAKAELEAAEAEAEASKDDFVSVKTDVKNLSSQRPKVAGVDPVYTTINGYDVTVGVPEGPDGRPYIGNDVPHSKFEWTDASWTRLNIFKDGHKRRGFRVISKDGEPVEEIWVLVPNNPAG